MGSNLAYDLASDELGLDLETSIGYHLRANHYPPVPDSMIQPCIDAIDAYWEDDIYREIDLNGNFYRNGATTAPAHAIVDAHHLHNFIDMDEEF